MPKFIYLFKNPIVKKVLKRSYYMFKLENCFVIFIMIMHVCINLLILLWNKLRHKSNITYPTLHSKSVAKQNLLLWSPQSITLLTESLCISALCENCFTLIKGPNNKHSFTHFLLFIMKNVVECRKKKSLYFGIHISPKQLN